MFELKNEYRARDGLGAVTEDTISVTRTMRAASPPASAADLIEQQQQRRPIVRARKGVCTDEVDLCFNMNIEGNGCGIAGHCKLVERETGGVK